MEMFLLIVLLGFANHLATTIVTESEIMRESREWIERRERRAESLRNVAEFASRLDGGPGAARGENVRALFWRKLSYLHKCHLCAGTWIGLVMAAFVPPIVSNGLVGWVLTALAIKGVGHIVLVVHKLLEAKEHQAEAYAKRPHAASRPVPVEQRHTHWAWDTSAKKMPPFDFRIDNA